MPPKQAPSVSRRTVASVRPHRILLRRLRFHPNSLATKHSTCGRQAVSLKNNEQGHRHLERTSKIQKAPQTDPDSRRDRKIDTPSSSPCLAKRSVEKPQHLRANSAPTNVNEQADELPREAGEPTEVHKTTRSCQTQPGTTREHHQRCRHKEQGDLETKGHDCAHNMVPC